MLVKAERCSGKIVTFWDLKPGHESKKGAVQLKFINLREPA